MTDTALLLFALLTSLKCTAIHVACWDGMFFAKHVPILPYLRRLPSLLSKPLYDCLTCMASLWGIVFGLFRFGFDIHAPWISFILCVCGINAVVEATLAYLRFAVIAKPE